MSVNTDLIEDFCKAWSRLDPVELAAYFSEDGVYHNMPAGYMLGTGDLDLAGDYATLGAGAMWRF